MDPQHTRIASAAVSPDAADPATPAEDEAAAAGLADSHAEREPDAAPDADDEADDPFDFGPVPVKYRHDGWVPERQRAFIEALADGGCVDRAARAVGMSRNSAYALRRRGDAQAFRLAWDAALENAVAQLADSALSRAIHGVAVPVFHDGEQVGERRHFDERLTMFLLRYRAPGRYGKWLDRMETHRHAEGPAWTLAYRIARMVQAAYRAFDAAFEGKPAPDPEHEIVEPFSDLAQERWRQSPGRASCS
jgi:hypothetical protein